MLNRVLEFVARRAYGKKAVEVIAFVHNGLDGKKTEIFSALFALSYVLEIVGVMPPDAASQMRTALGALIPAAFADRASKIAGAVKRVAGGQ